MSGYVGWGGLSDAFDETKSSWGYEYLELKSVLTEEEYTAARQSTLTAFYTPPVVIRAMYQALEDMGLKSGNILEPSCATGNFIGMKPDSLSDCKIYGVEIDSISGRIAQQLYQKSTIAVQGYEDETCRTVSLMWRLEMYLSDNSRYRTGGMTGTTSSYTITSLQRHWIKSDRAVWLPLSHLPAQWIRRTRQSVNISHSEQNFWEQSACRITHLRKMRERK